MHAKGEIQAKVWHTKSKKIPYNATERQETGNIENKYKIKINNFEINLSKRLSKFQIYDTIVLDNKFKMFSDFYLPISLEKITNKEIKEEQKKYSVEEAKDLGVEELQKELDNEIENKEKIVKRKDIESKPMDEEEAILQMELINHDFFGFKNVEEDCVSIVYKRKDGHYGIINLN